MRIVLLTAALTLAASLAWADPVWSVRPEPRLACMATSRAGSEILDGPRGRARPLAVAGGIVFILQPPHIDSGYVEVERPNRQTGWIEQSALAPAPDGCTPMLMSNGLVLPGSWP